MNIVIRKTYYDNWDTDINTKKEIEERYKDLNKDNDRLVKLPLELTKEENLTIKKASFEFFQKTIRSKWSDEDFKQTKDQIIENLEGYYTDLEEEDWFALHNIVIVFYNNENEKTVRNFIIKYISMLKLGNQKQKEISLTILGLIIRSSNLYFTVKLILDDFFNKNDIFIFDTLQEFIKLKKYKFTKIILKLFSNAYEFITIPDVLRRSDIIIPLINISIDVLDIEDPNDKYLLKTKKWASCFIDTVGIRNNHRTDSNYEVYDFIHEMHNFKRIYNVFIKQLCIENDNGSSYDSVYNYILEFLEKYANNDLVLQEMKKEYKFLITRCILPLNELNSQDEKEFINMHARYISARYAIFSENYRTRSCTLCLEIVRALDSDERDWLYNYFINIFESFKIKPNKETRKKVYGVLSLMKRIGDLDSKYYKDTFEMIVNKYILELFRNENLLLRSQCYYFLEYCNLNIYSEDHHLNILKITLEDLSHENDALRYCAICAINYFLNYSIGDEIIKEHLSEIIQIIVKFCYSYEVESLINLFESITDNYSKYIVNSYPDSVCLIGDLICDCITDYLFEGKVRSAYLENGALLEMYLNFTYHMELEKSKVAELYKKFHKTLKFIFKHQKRDYLIDALKITNNFLYNLEYVDECTLTLFGLILSLPAWSICGFDDQFFILINNVSFYGRDLQLDLVILEKIDSVIELYCKRNIISGYKIMDSMNVNYQGKILDTKRNEFYIGTIINNLCTNNVKEGRKYGVQVLGRCFYLKMFETLNILIKENEATERFFKHQLSTKGIFSFYFNGKKITLKLVYSFYTHMKYKYLE